MSRIIYWAVFLFLFFVSHACYAKQPVYNLVVSVYPEQRLLECKGSMCLDKESVTNGEFVLSLSNRMRDFTVQILYPAIKKEKYDFYKSDSSGNIFKYKIRLHDVTVLKDSLLLQFSYKGGEKTDFVFNIGREGSFASNAWYPLPEKDGRGTGQLQFIVPAEYKVLAPGKMTIKPKGEKTEYNFAIRNPADFTFTIGKYLIKEFSINGIVAKAYLLKERPQIKRYLDYCILILRTLEKEFGRHPYEDFNLVEIPTEKATEALFDGASVETGIWATTAFLDAPFNIAYFGHEIAHHWWGISLVRNSWDDTKGRYLLDEAMAQYGSLRAVEILEGKKEAERYRRTGYPGYIDLHSGTGYLITNAGGFDAPLEELPASANGRLLADSKGFFVVDMLGRTIGYKKFSTILKSILAKYKYAAITWTQFRDEISKQTSGKYNWFFDQWFKTTNVPDLKLSWFQKGNMITIIVEQNGSEFKSTLPLLIIGENKMQIQKQMFLDKKRNSITIPVNFKVTRIMEDPEFTLLSWNDEYRTLKPTWKAYSQAFNQMDNNNFIVADSLLLSALENIKSDNDYGAKFLLYVGLGQSRLRQDQPGDAIIYLQKAVHSSITIKELLPWVYFNLARAYKAISDINMLKWAVGKVAESEAEIGKYIGAAKAANDLVK